MATTTPNFGWPVPTSSDYVAQGAVAIEALGDAIDASVYAGAGSGLVLINATTITAQSSVQIQSIFSATYDYYRVEMAIDAPSTGAWTGVQMVSGSTPTTTSTYSYMRRFDYNTAAGGYESSATSDRMSVMFTSAAGFGYTGFDLANPFLTKNTFIAGTGASRVTAGGAGYGYLVQGITPDTTSYNGIKFLLPASCSGTVKIYGYRNS